LARPIVRLNQRQIAKHRPCIMDYSSTRSQFADCRAALCCALFALIPLNTMATENTPIATTADFVKRQELAEAETKALDAEKKRIDAQIALEEARKKLNAPPSPPDANAQAIAAAKATKEVADAEKAAADARTAAFKANYGGVPDSGIAGDVTLSEKAGTLETALLAHRALVDAARTIAEEVRGKLQAPSPTNATEAARPETSPALTLYVYPAGQIPNFQAVANFTVQRDAVKEALKQASDGAKSALAAARGGQREVVVTPAMVGVALESITKLLGFFRSDFKVGGSEVTLDDVALVQAVAGQDLTARVFVPVLYFPQAVRSAATLVSMELRELSEQQTQAKTLIGQLEQLIAAKQKQAGDQSLPATKASLESEIAELRPLVDRLKTATGAYDTILNRLMAPDEATGAMLRDLAVWNGLTKDGGRLLVLKVQRAGGSNYTKKNLWTAFGAMPFYVAGGAVVSYSLLRGEDGTVLASGVLPVHGGFESIKDVPDLVPARR
jgi:hypothetical protein